MVGSRWLGRFRLGLGWTREGRGRALSRLMVGYRLVLGCFNIGIVLISGGFGVGLGWVQGVRGDLGRFRVGLGGFGAGLEES